MCCWKAFDAEGLQDKKFPFAANRMFDDSPLNGFVFISCHPFVVICDGPMRFSFKAS
jgi:hypothetical protein